MKNKILSILLLAVRTFIIASLTAIFINYIANNTTFSDPTGLSKTQLTFNWSWIWQSTITLTLSVVLYFVYQITNEVLPEKLKFISPKRVGFDDNDSFFNGAISLIASIIAVVYCIMSNVDKCYPYDGFVYIGSLGLLLGISVGSKSAIHSLVFALFLAVITGIFENIQSHYVTYNVISNFEILTLIALSGRVIRMIWIFVFVTKHEFLSDL